MTDDIELQRHVLVSVHDVMPATLDRTEAICERLQQASMWPVTLLVVPGSGWDDATLARLHALHGQGAALAGHGWCHEVTNIRGWHHRLHSAFISRNVAEHLALDRNGVKQLMLDCYQWFIEQALPAPSLYVPPAWAMGNARRVDLDELPFDQYETLGGVYSSKAGVFRRLPMLGYEADTWLRALACRGWNTFNRLTRRGRPIRLSIHPDDFSLKLAADLAAALQAGDRAMAYGELDSPRSGVSAVNPGT